MVVPVRAGVKPDSHLSPDMLFSVITPKKQNSWLSSMVEGTLTSVLSKG